ncbi:MAG: hypothetical protein Q7R40_20160 [Phaeospirillum sp.]|nr:hypothetical protein [Phaeospirillum sp.]
MGGLFFTASLLVLVTAWWAGWLSTGAGRKPGRSVPLVLVVLTALVPPAMVTLVLMEAHSRFGDIRISLEGLRFEIGETGGRIFSIGGDDTSDAFKIDDLPPGFLAFEHEGNGVAVRLNQGMPAATGRSTRYGAVSVDGKCCYNTIRPHAPFRIRFDDGLEMKVDPKTETLMVGNDAFGPLPKRTLQNLGLPVLRQLPPEIESYPFRNYDSFHGAEPPSPIDPITWGKRQYASLMFWEEGEFNSSNPFGWLLRNNLAILLADPQMKVVTQTLSGELEETPGTDIAKLRFGVPASVRLGLHRIDIHPPAEDGKKKPSRIQERRSFRAKLVEGEHDETSGHKSLYLAVTLDTPYVITVRRNALNQLVSQGIGVAADRNLPAFVFAAEESHQKAVMGKPGQTNQTSSRKQAPMKQALLTFPMLGPEFGAEIFGRLEIDSPNSKYVVTSHDGVRSYNVGEAFVLGGKKAAIIRITEVQFPSGIIWVVWAASLAALLTGLSVRKDFHPWVAVGAVEAFLAIRILVGVQAGVLDHTEPATAWHALTAFAMVPWAVQACFMAFGSTPARRTVNVSRTLWTKLFNFRSLQFVGGPLTAAAFCALVVAYTKQPAWWFAFSVSAPVFIYLMSESLIRRLLNIGFVTGGGMAIASALATLVSLKAGHQYWPLFSLFPAAMYVALTAVISVVEWFFARTRIRKRLSWPTFGLLLLLVPGLRALLVLFGVKERFFLALSVLYTPATILIFAWVFEAYRKRRPTWPHHAWSAPLLFCLAAALTLVAAPFVAHDIGVVFVFTIPIIALFAAVAIMTGAPPDPQTSRRIGWLSERLRITLAVLPFVLAATVLTIPGITTSTLSFLNPEGFFADDLDYSSAMRAPELARHLIESQVKVSQNMLRIWNYTAPERLTQFGTAKADDFVTVMETMRRYVSTGWLGKGLIGDGLELSPILKSTHTNDNVSAVHLLAPFGTFGAISVILLLGSWTVFAFRGGLAAGLSGRAIMGVLSVWTLFGASTYMILVNLEIVPFTGKNVYFLSVASHSDLIEATILAVLGGWAFMRRRFQ